MMRSAKRSLSEQFTDLYTYALAFLCFIAIATSMSFSFRSVRGSYGGFTLDNSNAVFFFMGALLICCSLLCAVIRALGPVGYSAGELFWRFRSLVLEDYLKIRGKLCQSGERSSPGRYLPFYWRLFLLHFLQRGLSEPPWELSSMV